MRIAPIGLIVLCVLLGIQSIAFAQEIVSNDFCSVQMPEGWIQRDFQGFELMISEEPSEQLSFMSTFSLERDSANSTHISELDSIESIWRSNPDISNFQVQSKKDVTCSGLNGIEYHCRGVISGIPLEWKTKVFLRKGEVVRFTFTSMVRLFVLKNRTCDAIFNSLDIW